jgi:hypothetical protein
VSIIITTNLSLAGGKESQFALHIGGRSYDRLSEMAPAGFMVGLDGVPSWRQKIIAGRDTAISTGTMYWRYTDDYE